MKPILHEINIDNYKNSNGDISITKKKNHHEYDPLTLFIFLTKYLFLQ